MLNRGNGISYFTGVGGTLVVDPILAGIAEGRFFAGGKMFENVPDLGVAEFLMIVPSDHKDGISVGEEKGAVCFRAIAQEKARLTLKYDITIGTNGTKVNLINQNLNSLNPLSNVDVYHTPTGISGGRPLIVDKPINGGKIWESGFMILVPGKNYLFTIQNVSGVNDDIYLEAAELEFTHI